MAKPAHAVIFQIRAGCFDGKWLALLDDFRPVRTKRTTDDYGAWRRVTGKGYQIWISEVRILGSMANPPIWEFRVESLVPLNDEGQEQWEMLVTGLQQRFDECKLEYSATDSGS